MGDESTTEAGMGGSGSGGRRRVLVRGLRVVLVLVLLGIVAVALVPTILSTASFRNSLLAEANRELGGTVELDDLSIALTGHQRLAGLTLWPGAPGVGEPLLDVPEAAFEKDLLPLLLGRLVFRGRVQGFRARLVVHADGSTSLGDFLGGHRRGAGRLDRRIASGELLPSDRSPPAPRLVRDLRTLWPPTVCDVRLADGSALLVDERLGTTRGVEGLDIALVSDRYEDPLELRLRATVRVDEARAPVELTARALGSWERRWELHARAERLPPGSLLGPLLAAACPLLAGDGSGAPLSVDAPLELELRLAGDDVERLVDGLDDPSTAGRATVRLGPGRHAGVLLGRAQATLDALVARGIVPLEPDGTPPRLTLHGYVATLAVAAGQATVEDAALLDAQGRAHPLAVEGHADLHGWLAMRVPWPDLVPGVPALHGRALRVEGRWDRPTVDDGLADLLESEPDGAHGAPVDGTAAPGAHADLEDSLRRRLEGGAPRR